MNKRCGPVPLFCAIALVAISLSCIPRRVVTATAAPHGEKAAFAEAAGYCSIATARGGVKARAAARREHGVMTALLVDEFGITLAAVCATDSTDSLIHFFPPISPETAGIFGLAINAWIGLQHAHPSQDAAGSPARRRKGKSPYYISRNAPDSAVVAKGRNRYSLYSSSRSFTLLGSKRDTLCSCFWDE